MVRCCRSTVLALSESYPALEAAVSFKRLQERLSDIEERIPDRREFYNASVNALNTRIEQFPDVVVARLISEVRRELFTVGGARLDAAASRFP